MTREQIIKMLDNHAVSYQMTGSRYICNPAPTDTDEDYVALAAVGNDKLIRDMINAGFDMNTDPQKYEDLPQFLAFRKGEFNIIVTLDAEFYGLFVKATEQAKAKNLMEKADRIALFRDVLYGEVSF